MDAVGPYFPIDMTQDCLILLSLSKKRPKNNLLRRVACSRRGSSMQIRKTQFFFETPCIFLHSQFVPFPLSSSCSSLITEFPDNQPDTANLYCWSITWSSRSGERDILQDHQREHQGGNHTKHQQQKKDKKNSSSRFCPLQRPLLLSYWYLWPN